MPSDAVTQVVPEGDAELAAGLFQAGEAVAAAFAQIAAGAAADNGQIEREALLDESAEQRTFGGDAPMVLALDPEGVEMRFPGRRPKRSSQRSASAGGAAAPWADAPPAGRTGRVR